MQAWSSGVAGALGEIVVLVAEMEGPGRGAGWE